MNQKIYIIHENDEWTNHLTKRLEELGYPYESWFLNEGMVDLTKEPPKGVFYNRMSASSHTRNHHYAPELAGAVIDWLEYHGRKVFNGSNALRLELSKVKQYVALEKAGIKIPRTIAAVGKTQIVQAAKDLNLFPFIIKHNRAGKGLGVQLFQSIESLELFIQTIEFEDSRDGITLVQEYIQSPTGSITRAEFINKKYLYSVRVKTDDGFELCPADVCQIGDAFCPTSQNSETEMKFKIIDNPHLDLIKKYEQFLIDANIDVAGIEFIEDELGNTYTYDVNTNTNYNPDAEAEKDVYAMLELAKFLGENLT